MINVFGLPSSTDGNIFYFGPNSTITGTSWVPWTRPRGSSMLYMLCYAAGGAGRAGFVGAASAAGGGGGGGSSSQSAVLIPTVLLPDTLFFSVGQEINTATGINSFVAIKGWTSNITINLVLAANGGTRGGTGTSGAGGTSGGGGSVNTTTECPLAGLGTNSFIAGQAGIAGGFSAAGANLTLPVTGLIVTGGTGGGGLPAANTAGFAGGNFVVPSGLSTFPAASGGAGGTTAPTAGSVGAPGFMLRAPGFPAYFYGGTGGGSSGLDVTPTGANGGIGGDGAFGCGGGGGGAAFTGFASGISHAGPGLVILVVW